MANEILPGQTKTFEAIYTGSTGFIAEALVPNPKRELFRVTTPAFTLTNSEIEAANYGFVPSIDSFSFMGTANITVPVEAEVGEYSAKLFYFDFFFTIINPGFPNTYYTSGRTFNINFTVLSADEEQFGSLTDKMGVLFSAVNEATGVRVSKFKSGAASRELLALIPNAKNPSIYKDRRNSIRLAYQDRTDGATKVLRSDNGGSTFS